MRILITGGAGFVGSNLSVFLKQSIEGCEVCALDNLHRQNTPLTLRRLTDAGVEFVHGDVRFEKDLLEAGRFNVLVECSAEPSVHAGYRSNPGYVIDTNLLGTAHCLEAARQNAADVIFLSTSRVYPIETLRTLPLRRMGERLDLEPGATGTGWSTAGITTNFPLTGPRSLYGATKLASELLLEEYRSMYGLRTVVNRCGVISGPWQMGKVDQGFFVLWAARHLFDLPLAYQGFGGLGHQVRDVLHVMDLCELIHRQIEHIADYDGRTFNAGGGHKNSVSLVELTNNCRERTGRAVQISQSVETSPADVPYYVTDNSAVTDITGWRPRRSIETLLDDVFAWLGENRESLMGVFVTEASPKRPAVVN